MVGELKVFSCAFSKGLADFRWRVRLYFESAGSLDAVCEGFVTVGIVFTGSEWMVAGWISCEFLCFGLVGLFFLPCEDVS